MVVLVNDVYYHANGPLKVPNVFMSKVMCVFVIVFNSNFFNIIGFVELCL